MSLLITGASGLLGNHLVEQATIKNQEFIGLARGFNQRSVFSVQTELQSKFKKFDLLVDEMDSSFSCINTVVHAAAWASPLKDDEQKMHEINVLAAKKLYVSLRQMGLKHWIQISSTALLTGDGDHMAMITEDSPRQVRKTAYAHTKYEIEMWLRSQNDGIKKTYIYPGYMLGKWDAKPSSGSIFFALKMGKFKNYLEASKNFVLAKDVAIGVLEIAKRNLDGDYILGGKNESIKSFLQKACEKLHCDFSTLTEITNDIDGVTEFVREFCSTLPCSSSKAMDKFGYHPELNIESMIEEAISYFIEYRMLRIIR